MKLVFCIFVGFLVSGPLSMAEEGAVEVTETEKSEKSEKAKKKVFDPDKLACEWNKTPQEAAEKCKKDPNKKPMAKRLDDQLNKDAKKIKSFFGIKSKKEREAEKKAEESKESN